MKQNKIVFIQDGKGRGFNAAVGDDNHLQTDSFTLSKVGETSLDDGQTYSWSSRYLVDPGSSIIYIQNTSPTKNLIIDHIDVGGESGTTWELWSCTTDGGGIVVSGNNLNLASSNSAEARAFGDANITSNASGILLGYAKHNDMETEEIHVSDALILGQNDAIIIKKPLTPANSTTSGICSVIGYFE